MRTIRVGLVLVKFQMPCPIPDSLNQDPQKAVDLKTPGSHQPAWPWSSGGSFARIKAMFRRKRDTPRSAQQQRQGGAWLPPTVIRETAFLTPTPRRKCLSQPHLPQKLLLRKQEREGPAAPDVPPAPLPAAQHLDLLFCGSSLQILLRP